MIPRAYRDEPDAVVREPGDTTQMYDFTLRQPAATLAERWPIVAGLDAGAPVELIIASLVAGRRWRVGPASKAIGRARVWLSPIDVPYDRQIVACYLGGVV